MATATQGWSSVRAISQSPPAHAALVWSAFLVSRFLFLYAQLVLLPTSGDCDVRIYARYAAAYQQASAEGGSVYDYCQPEYPHLALVVMAVPQLGANAASGFAAYRGLYRLEMALFDLLAFLTVLWLIRTHFRDEPAWRRTARLLAYVVGGLLLPTLFYTRLDVVVGALVVLSLALLVSRWHYVLSFVVLAAAVNFKLVPVVLIPLWVVASLPAALVGGVRNKGGVWRLLAVGGWRSAVAVALTVAFALPAYVSSGGRSLAFLQYHAGRGLEIGSVYSSALLALRPLGLPCDFGFAYGCLNVDAPAAPLLARISPYLTLALVLAATFFSCRLLLRRKYEASRGPSGAYNSVGGLASGAALVLAAFMAGNKVFSPQYLLWLVPLLPLLPWPTLSRRLGGALFAAACAVSTLTMLVWQRHVIGDEDWIDTVTNVSGPTALGGALLVARNVVFLGFVALLAWIMYRQMIVRLDGTR